MIRACLCLLAGVYAPQLSSFAVHSDRVRAAMVASLVLLAVPRLRGLGCLLLGCFLFLGAANAVIDSRVATALVGDSIVAGIRIADFPDLTRRPVNFIATPVDDPRLPERMRISWFAPPVSLRQGDTWQLELRLRRPRGTSNPGVFDYEEWLFREAVGAVGYVVDSHRNHLLDAGPPGIVQALRQRFVDRVAVLVSDPSQAAVLAAIVVGARQQITRQQWDRYARTGTSHLVAISGLHIGLAAGGSYVLACCFAGLLRFGGNQHQVAITVSLLVAVLYALVSGFAVPSRRASLMIALAGVALLRRRVPQPAVVIAAACVAIVVATPLATMAPGFKLSFAAVLILLWLARRYRGAAAERARRRTQALLAARQLATAQLLLFLGLLPATVLIFGRIAFAAPLVNLLAVPFFSLVTVPFALLGLLLDGPLQFAGDRALLVAANSIGLVEFLIARAAAAEWAAPAIPAITGLAYLYVVLPVVWVAAPVGWPGRHLAWLAVVAVVLHVPRTPPPGCAALQVLDVGQGLAALVQTQRYALLYDTGPAFRGGSSAAESIIVPYLARRGIKRIDRLVVSHADLDHAGGVAAILQAVDVGELVAGESLSAPGIAMQHCKAGDSWRSDGVDFRVLHPPANVRYEGNDASCVVQVEAGRHRLLLTGDIERRVEEQLVRSGIVDGVHAVVVPHHGSRSSSSPSFVRALRAAVAIVPAGFGNRWGFPRQDVVDRWSTAGTEVLTTAASGAVSLVVCAGDEPVSVRKHRQERHRIWHE